MKNESLFAGNSTPEASCGENVEAAGLMRVAEAAQRASWTMVYEDNAGARDGQELIDALAAIGMAGRPKPRAEGEAA